MNNEASLRGKILIVDDNPTNLNVLFDFLHDAGYKVLVAESGASALRRSALGQPDLILLDVLMPGMDGFETCRQLKENPATANIPVILMTALSETTDKVKGFAAGAVDYVTKPAQYEELLARINTHLHLRRLKDNLQLEVQRREQLIAELSAYAHTVAHDLKAPLGALLGFAELLEEGLPTASPEELRPLTQRIRQSGQKMVTIIDGLLLLASVRLEDAPRRLVNMMVVYAEAEARLNSLIMAYEAELTRPSTWPTVSAYSPWVEEVWVNYLSNAIKYGGKPPRIEVGSTLLKDNKAAFWVQDNGPGLTPAEIEQLFTPFIRIKHAADVEGHGLGLSIVHRIITKLGGEVGVESTPGKGSRFYFILPLATEEK